MHKLKLYLTALLIFNFCIISSNMDSEIKNEAFENSLELIKEILEKDEE